MYLIFCILILFSDGKFLGDNISLGTIEFKGQKQLYLKDLGPQIGWKTVSMFSVFLF